MKLAPILQSVRDPPSSAFHANLTFPIPGETLHTSITVAGSQCWALCDTGAGFTILDSAWATTHQIPNTGSRSISVQLADNTSKSLVVGVSPPLTFTIGKLTVTAPVYLLPNPKEILTLGTRQHFSQHFPFTLIPP